MAKDVSSYGQRSWLYNNRSELVGATVGANVYGYDYDTIGNRLWSSANGVTNDYAANCLNQYTGVQHSTFNIQPSYDADGNLTNDGTFSYAYDAENRLVSTTSAVETNGAIRVLSAYDHRNRRIRKTVQRLLDTNPPPPSAPTGTREWQTVETHVFVWDGNNIVLEKIVLADGTSHMVEYFWGGDISGTEQGAGGVGGLLAVSRDGVFHVPCYDHNGNVVVYVSETGTIATQYAYDPYGNIVETYGTLADQFAFGFSTKYHDREIGMIAYQRRFYLPALGRWLNRDPIEEEGGEKLYAFCGNAPMSLYDMLGLACKPGMFNITRNIDIKVKSALYGGDEVLVHGRNLFDSLSLLNRAIQISSLYGGTVGVVVSAVDNAVGEGLSPDAEAALRAIEKMMEKLRGGPLVVYGRLEWEKCVCVSNRTKFVRQTPIDGEVEVSVEELYTNQNALMEARREVLKDLISVMYSRLGKR